MRSSHACERWSRALVAWRLCEARALDAGRALIEAETAWCLALAAHSQGEASVAELARARVALLGASRAAEAARRRARRVGTIATHRLNRFTAAR